MAGRIEARLNDLGLRLPSPMVAVGSYVPWRFDGSHLYIAGQGAARDGALHFLGRVGDTVSLEEAVESARLTALNLLAQAKAGLGGDLDRIRRIVKLGGFVHCTPDFTEQPKVIDGASDLMVEIFGEAGRHARFAVGASALPMGLSVEIDALFEVANQGAEHGG